MSNDYLGFSQHPTIKTAVIKGIEQFGTGSGASPAIGGHFSYHEMLEKKIAAFYRGQRRSCIPPAIQRIVQPCNACCMNRTSAIIDMAVHASVYEGCLKTNTKQFLHNNLEHRTNPAKAKDAYRTKFVIVDGVYSQTGISPCWTGSPRSLIIMGPTLLWTTRTESAWLAIPAGA
ncbi:aminotransferase class I/II-fold pyridoxal phosphate-dependent enzyme [Mucilaginibacter humi]|uniref:aminotransferase class I/II-fold pyridoxal phosphate-dependent enzyme n=1 Tax=Mucilaginibacter humi TaxID=2732510 RepID=UPI00293B95C0|nr:aminotransferase class I/II-fold pyridoxal phosphate-dependent enzyme [Mucilaginibacter humi]